MINSALSMWGGAADADYLAGNAQVFDGAFDNDLILAPLTPIQATDAVSYLLCFTDNGAAGSATLLSLQNVGIWCYTQFGDLIFRYFTTGANSTTWQIPYPAIGVPIQYAISFDGSGLATGVKVYVDGVLATPAYTGKLNLSLRTIDANNRVAAYNTGSRFWKGKMKTFEILDREATAQEMADATTSGSFRGAGIAFDSGDYRLAIDFDKTNGQDPTTFTDTPAHTISGLGGTEYEEYL